MTLHTIARTSARTLCRAATSAVLASAFLFSTGAAAQTPVELRYATSAPAKTVWADQVERMVKIISDASGGNVKINAFLNSQLGSEQDTIQQIARGRIDMGGYSVAAASLLVPELALTGMPFLFKDVAQQDCVFDKHVTKLSSDLLARKGVHFLSWSHVGVSQIIGKKPYTKPEDIKGLKARAAPTKLAPFMWQAFGAHPNPMPVTEWNAAFQSGLIDLADSGYTYYMFSGLNKLAPVVTMTGHIDAGGIVVINKATWDKLPDAAKKAIEKSVTEAPAATLRKEVRDFEAKLVGLHKSQGGTVVDLTAEQREGFRKVMTSAWPKMVESIGGESSVMWKAIQDGLAACN